MSHLGTESSFKKKPPSSMSGMKTMGEIAIDMFMSGAPALIARPSAWATIEMQMQAAMKMKYLSASA
jgi:hypothetical protein